MHGNASLKSSELAKRPRNDPSATNLTDSPFENDMTQTALENILMDTE